MPSLSLSLSLTDDGDERAHFSEPSALQRASLSCADARDARYVKRFPPVLAIQTLARMKQSFFECFCVVYMDTFACFSLLIDRGSGDGGGFPKRNPTQDCAAFLNSCLPASRFAVCASDAEKRARTGNPLCPACICGRRDPRSCAVLYAGAFLTSSLFLFIYIFSYVQHFFVVHSMMRLAVCQCCIGQLAASPTQSYHRSLSFVKYCLTPEHRKEGKLPLLRDI